MKGAPDGSIRTAWILPRITNNEHFTYIDSNLTCWDRTLKANGGTLTSYKDGCGKK